MKGFKRQITEDTCKKISLALSVAMAKLHAPEMLEMEFLGKFNRTMRNITVDYKDKITSLDIDVYCNADLLLQQNFHFECLESLKLSNFCPCNDDIVKACEAMLDKHANNLKNLKLEDFFSKNLRVPDIPKLDSLTLYIVGEEAAWNILEKCRPSITSLVIDDTEMESPPFNNDDSNKTAVYQIPNLEHLNITFSKAFKFVIFNADYLVSLELSFIRDIPEDFVWPQFPNLRELSIISIFGVNYLPILINCRDTLERLILDACTYDYGYSGLIMPRLTDLYIIIHEDNVSFTSKFCSSNYKSLEFLFLMGSCLPNYDGGIKMERMRNVVLGYNSPSYTEQDRERMAVMCPNAEVIILSEEKRGEMRDLVISRFKQRNFDFFCYI